MRQPVERSLIACFAVAVAVVLGCGGDDAPIVRVDYSRAFRATLANPASPEMQEGERMYYEETWGAELLGGWPSDFLVALWQSDPARWGEQFSSYGWLVDPGDDLPVGLKRGTTDPTITVVNCAACHVARLADGRIWSGFPAVELELARFQLDVNEAWMAAGNPSQLDTETLVKLPQISVPGMTNVEEAGAPLVPVDFPPYMNLGLRDDLGGTGSAANARSVILISVFSLRGGADNPEPFPPADVTQPFVDYLAGLGTPPPVDVDAVAAERGAAVFAAAECGSCHHPENLLDDEVVEWAEGAELLPGDSEEHPTGTIATDRTLLGLGDFNGGVGESYGDFIDFLIAQGLMFGPSDGYVPRDLHALFGSAPYLHNGSVPTLEDLLRPASERPATFERSGVTVDTAASGMSNAGHEFGVDLPEADKAALVAHLRSL